MSASIIFSLSSLFHGLPCGMFTSVFVQVHLFKGICSPATSLSLSFSPLPSFSSSPPCFLCPSHTKTILQGSPLIPSRMFTENTHTKDLMALHINPIETQHSLTLCLWTQWETQRSYDFILQSTHGPRLCLRGKSEGERWNCLSVFTQCTACIQTGIQDKYTRLS